MDEATDGDGPHDDDLLVIVSRPGGHRSAIARVTQQDLDRQDDRGADDITAPPLLRAHVLGRDTHDTHDTQPDAASTRGAR